MVGEAKAAGRGFRTNFYLSDAAIESALRGGELLALRSDGGVLMLKRERDLARLYYAVAEPARLPAALAQLTDRVCGVLVADLIGRPEETAVFEPAFAEAGFSRYTRFLRMQKTMPAGLPTAEDDRLVKTAQPRDAEAVLAAIQGHFDPYCEHFPPLAEIREAIARGTILVIRDGPRLAALLYYDRTGLTTNFRYWIVEPGYRRHAYGDRLIRRYFRDCAGCRRSVLWVEETNARAIPVHRWYGYQPDSVIDVILIKRP